MDRITRVRIRNVRAIEALDLDLSALTVLIGENGSGKSTILECLELLRKAAEPTFFDQFYNLHRGMPGLLRKGATSLELGVLIEDDDGRERSLEYSFELRSGGFAAVVEGERFRLGDVPSECLPAGLSEKIEAMKQAASGLEDMFAAADTHRRVLLRQDLVRTRTELAELQRSAFAYDWLVSSNDEKALLSAVSMAGLEATRLRAALRGIEVHVGFDTRASWAARSYQRPESLRVATTHFPADRLSLLGFNLANAWSALRGQATTDWELTMALVRLGLGDRVDSVLVTPDMGGGNIYLAVRFVDLADPVYASDLSDGQLSWLAFVAMARLNKGRSLLAVDEPEQHLHPSLLARVVALLAQESERCTVLLSTHSDRLLGLLDDPADAVRVCGFSQAGTVEVSRLDRAELDRWLEEFGDLGQLRANGYLRRVLSDPEGA